MDAEFTPEQRMGWAVQILSGLLASGHYSRLVGDGDRTEPELIYNDAVAPVVVYEAIEILIELEDKL